MRRLIIPMVAILFLVLATSMVSAQTKFSGTMEMKNASVDTVFIDDVEGHNMMLSVSEGINAGGVEGDIFDGATALNISSSDLVKGNGDIFGYTKLVKGDDVLFNKWKGVLTTVIDAEGKPKSTFKGSYELINGAGAFANIKGTGTFSGYYTSPSNYVAEWEGEYVTE